MSDIEELDHNEIDDKGEMDIVQQALGLKDHALEAIHIATRKGEEMQAALNQAQKGFDSLKLESVALRSEKDRWESLAEKHMKHNTLLRSFIETSMVITKSFTTNCKEPVRYILEGKAQLTAGNFVEKSQQVLSETK